MNTAYIALGSNLGSPLEQVTRACKMIESLGRITKKSSWYKSKAVGPGDQADYINGVASLSTSLEPIDLLDALQEIEHREGRVRIEHWGPRTLDLDILLYNNSVISTDRLVLPHPLMRERNFVMIPLHEIASELIFPDGAAIFDIVKSLNHDGLEKLT